jgi:hypothetical protein
MFLWYPVMDLARAPRRARLTARKKDSGYENGGTEYLQRSHFMQVNLAFFFLLSHAVP